MTNDVPGYGLGCLPEFDTRSRNYPVRALLSGAPPIDRRWALNTHLNQGNTPRCVGYSCAHELAAEPVVIPVTNVSGDNIYNLAQQLDEWPGTNYDGTSVLAGMKALKQFGYIGEYRWAFGIDDMVQALGEIGPVVVGTSWYTSMFTPTAEGRVVISGTAGTIGHAYCFTQSEVSKGRIWFDNTWGDGWGIKGRAWFDINDFSMLLKQGGVAAIITQRFDPSAPTPPPQPPMPPVPPTPPPPAPVSPVGLTSSTTTVSRTGNVWFANTTAVDANGKRWSGGTSLA